MLVVTALSRAYDLYAPKDFAANDAVLFCSSLLLLFISSSEPCKHCLMLLACNFVGKTIKTFKNLPKNNNGDEVIDTVSK